MQSRLPPKRKKLNDSACHNQQLELQTATIITNNTSQNISHNIKTCSLSVNDNEQVSLTIQDEEIGTCKSEIEKTVFNLQELLATQGVAHIMVGDNLVELVPAGSLDDGQLHQRPKKLDQQEAILSSLKLPSTDMENAHHHINSGQPANIILALVPVAVSQFSSADVDSTSGELPSWIYHMHEWEKIGDFYRGWVQTESELDLLLALHKQQTQSMWGTRQSPTPGKSSTRLMWKSQYVPFDGIPFLNTGSRATVMECQFGPRKMGGSKHSHSNIYQVTESFKQTCTARIYVKKVKKFPLFAVDLSMDKKLLKAAMDDSFQKLKVQNLKEIGQDRFYVQLPTEAAHCYHSSSLIHPDEEHIINIQELGRIQTTDVVVGLHPEVSERIRELVSAGHTNAYTIRKLLRRYVEKELSPRLDVLPEKHNLSFFPTINEIYNQIHQVLQDLNSIELNAKDTGLRQDLNNLSIHYANYKCVCKTYKMQQDSWPIDNDTSSAAESVIINSEPDEEKSAEQPIPQSVTLMLKISADGESHTISSVETHMSDGTVRVSSTVSADIAHLISQLNPENISITSVNESQNKGEHQSTNVNLVQNDSSTVGVITLHESMMVNPNVAAGTQEEETVAAAQHLSSAETALSTDSSLAGQGHSLWGASASGDVHSLCVLDEITASDSTDPILEDLSESVVVEVVDYGLDDVHPVTNLVIDDTDTQSTVSELGLCSQR